MTRSPGRVLVLAYACEPGRGSEPGAGWEWAAAAAERHEVTLLTSARHAGPVREALAGPNAPPFAAVHFLEEAVGPMRTRPGPGVHHRRYRRWQRAAVPFIHGLHAEQGFDLAHHLTWAVDWQPTAAAGIPDVPCLWGPVGGTTSTQLRMARWLGPRGLANDLAREVITRPARRVVGRRVARQSSLVLAQNSDAQRYFAPLAPTELAPNPAVRVPAVAPVRSDTDGDGSSRPMAVFAGRLLPWKGLRLAVAALARAERWHLTVFGLGPDETPARRLATRLGCAGRIEFRGERPRDEVLAGVAGADALLQPSLHDSGPWIVAEAVTLGTPVVALDRGGPPDLVRDGRAGVIVPADGRAPQALAAALDHLPTVEPADHWRAERLPDQIEGHYRRALEQADAREAVA